MCVLPSLLRLHIFTLLAFILMFSRQPQHRNFSEGRRWYFQKELLHEKVTPSMQASMSYSMYHSWLIILCFTFYNKLPVGIKSMTARLPLQVDTELDVFDTSEI